MEYEDIDEDEALAENFSKLFESLEKGMEPFQEVVEVINFGTEEEKKELKIVDNPERQEMIALLKEYLDIFAWSYRDMPGLNPTIATHKIPTYDHVPTKQQRLRRMSTEMSLKIKEEVAKQLEAGFIEVVRYPTWLANIVPVPKKDGRVRMCVDYRDLNKASPKDNFPLPHIDVLVDSTAKYHRFSFMDGYSGYNQILMDEEDKIKTGFISAWGAYCYRVMPFGLKNAGATYQRAMVTLFHDMMHQEIEVYVDDMVAKSVDGTSHVDVLRKLFERMRKYDLRLNPAKCTFGASSGKLLGFIVSRKGIEVDPDKVKAIQEMPSPKTEKQVRSFLGRLNYIARFISNLTHKCEPIFKLLRKSNTEKWNERCQEAFETIKEYLQNPPILVPPIPKRPLILYMTVLYDSMGAMLAQHNDEGKEQAIYYLSKKFNECETRYPPVEKTCCALVWASKKLRQYLLSHTTMLVSRLDPLKYILECPHISQRVSKWQMILTEFDIHFVTRKSVKGSALADFLAVNPTKGTQDIDVQFPDEELMMIEESKDEEDDTWEMYFDGAVNVHGNGVGAVLISPEAKQFPVAIKLTFESTNNTAEYEACVIGLKAALELKIKKLKVYGDSALIIYQVKGEWQTRDVKLIPYQRYLTQLVSQFDVITFDHVSRDKNPFADALATLASMIELDCSMEIQPLQINTQDKPSYCMSLDISSDEKPWYEDFKKYIQHREYPDYANENEKKMIRRMSSNFFLSGETLYKRTRDGTLLRCVHGKEIKTILHEVHEGICGTHANGYAMAKQIMRYGYYWSTMESDCYEYVMKCHKCQIYADKIHSPPFPLHNMVSPWPFAMWGIDVIGMIHPKASNGHRFILVAIDYFTKWVEAESYAHVTQKVLLKFLKRNIICRYGLPDRIITDNATNLNGEMVQSFCEKFKIKHHNSSPYRPQMNGAVEAANKNIKKILSKMVITYKDWHEMLPYALHAYRTSVRTSTNATPYSLVYGMEAVTPIEVEIPSLRILMEAELDDAEWVQARYDQLNLIEEKRLEAIYHGQLYQNRMARAFNKKVRPRSFRPGELVIKRILPNQEDDRGKWAPTYEGPYIVKNAFSGGALILTDMDGNELPKPVNADALKKYHKYFT